MNNDLKIFAGIIVATLLLIVGAIFLMGKSNSSSPTSSDKPVASDVLIKSDSWSEGPQDAKATLVEFGDFECPSCKITEPMVHALRTKYQNKIRYVFREFPLTQIHELALDAAIAAEAAGVQGKFWDYHDKLYEHQPNFKRPELISYAKDLGLDVDKFTKDLDSDALRTRVLTDQQDGFKANINGTPTFFINGKRVINGSDSQLLPIQKDFENIIDPLLK